jgi:hypothetical protein
MRVADGAIAGDLTGVGPAIVTLTPGARRRSRIASSLARPEAGQARKQPRPGAPMGPP